MRTIKTDLYLYDELNETAKKKAIEQCREYVAGICNETDDDAYRNTLERIEEVFQIDVYGWDTDYLAYRYRFTNERWSDHGEDPKMLVRYLNCVSDNLFKGRYYSKLTRLGNGKFKHSCRHSKILPDANNCTLTGMWCDWAVMNAMKESAKYIHAAWTICDFLDAMLTDFFCRWYENYNINASDENVGEYLEDYSLCEFMADGTRYN